MLFLVSEIARFLGCHNVNRNGNSRDFGGLSYPQFQVFWSASAGTAVHLLGTPRPVFTPMCV